MNSGLRKLVLFGIVPAAMTLTSHAQGTFQNLDFESARVPNIPAGQYGGKVSPSEAIPGWTAYWGTLQSGEVWHNDITIGSPSVILYGPYWSSYVLQGRYSVTLNSGYDPTFPNNTSAIGQVGQIPSTAQSLVFSARIATLEVTFGGTHIPISSIGSTGNYGIYGGDVRAFAGLTGELRFTAYPLSPHGFGGAALDAIQFSPSLIPEPSSFGLLGAGVLLLGWRWRSRRSR